MKISTRKALRAMITFFSSIPLFYFYAYDNLYLWCFPRNPAYTKIGRSFDTAIECFSHRSIETLFSIHGIYIAIFVILSIILIRKNVSWWLMIISYVLYYLAGKAGLLILLIMSF